MRLQQFSNSIYEVQGPEHSTSSAPTRPSGEPQTSDPLEADQPTLRERAKALWSSVVETAHNFSGALVLLVALSCGIWLLFDTLRASNYMIRVVHYLFWLPQFARNVRRNMRMALSWEYVLIVSAGRLFVVMCESRALLHLSSADCRRC